MGNSFVESQYKRVGEYEDWRYNFEEILGSKLEMTMDFALLKSKEVWIMDSGASGHSTNCLDGATEIRESGSESIGHSGSATKTSVSQGCLCRRMELVE